MAKRKEFPHQAYHGLEAQVDQYLQERGVSLTPKEQQLLCYLLRNANIAVSRNNILAHVWGYSYGGHSRTIDVHIQHLRKKLHWEKYIQTVFKVGYRLDLSAMLYSSSPKHPVLCARPLPDKAKKP